MPDLFRNHGICSASFYKRQSKYGGTAGSDMKRLNDLEEENRRLKKMYAESQIDAEILKDELAVGY